MRLLLFIILEIIVLPLQIVGLIVWFYRLRRISIPQKISGTANEPYGNRLLLHVAGTRDDPAAYALAGHLPVFDKFVTFTMIKTAGFASRLSGYKGSIFAYPGKRPSSMSEVVSHRTAFFDSVISEALCREDNPVRQFVVLGSGYDTRCYDLPDGAQVKCFEVDMAPTLNAKLKGLNSAGIAHDHVTFVETDFNQENWLDALTEAGFDKNLTTFILWEGVTMYISEESVLDTLKQAATLAPGSAIAFDYFSKEFIDGEPPFHKTHKSLKRAIAITYKEVLIYGITTRKPARDAIDKFVVDCGLQLVAFEHTDEEKPPKAPLFCFALAVNK